jgi:hypothetical protein
VVIFIVIVIEKCLRACSGGRNLVCYVSMVLMWMRINSVLQYNARRSGALQHGWVGHK